MSTCVSVDFGTDSEPMHTDQRGVGGVGGRQRQSERGETETERKAEEVQDTETETESQTCKENN